MPPHTRKPALTRPSATGSTTPCWHGQLRPTLIPPSQRTPADKDAANKVHKASHDQLRALQRASGGCGDCTARMSGWAALPHGVFVCINCAQIHRRIGRHISQVKAVNTGTYLWYPDEIEVMAYGGNARVQAEYCASVSAPRCPDESAPAHVKEAYVRQKYEERRWYVPGGTQDTKTPHGRTQAASKSSARSEATLTNRPVAVENVMDDNSGFDAWKAVAAVASPPIVSGGSGADFFGSWGV